MHCQETSGLPSQPAFRQSSRLQQALMVYGVRCLLPTL